MIYSEHCREVFGNNGFCGLLFELAIGKETKQLAPISTYHMHRRDCIKSNSVLKHALKYRKSLIVSNNLRTTIVSL